MCVMLHKEKSGARVLKIAGEMDEAWPSEYPEKLLQGRLKEAAYPQEIKTICYPSGSHLTGQVSVP